MNKRSHRWEMWTRFERNAGSNEWGQYRTQQCGGQLALASSKLYARQWGQGVKMFSGGLASVCMRALLKVCVRAETQEHIIAAAERRNSQACTTIASQCLANDRCTQLLVDKTVAIAGKRFWWIVFPPHHLARYILWQSLKHFPMNNCKLRK